jgi:hypothetical protein
MASAGPTPSPTAREFPEHAREQARAAAVAWIERNLTYLWPGARNDDGGFDWSLLVDGMGREGRDRLDGQYVRANVNPGDLYVQSLPGSARHRLPAEGSGVDNLVLAGDWTRNGLNLGCIEAAVMSGLQAARAISGRPATIPGESDFPD